MNLVSKISVFDFFDYREYLGEAISAMRQKDSAFSLRKLQEELDIPGSAFFARVLDGSRPFTPEYVSRISAKLKHSSEESAFFEILIQFCEEKHVDRREGFLRELIKLRSSQAQHALQDQRLAFFSKWYFPVLRDLIPLLDPEADSQTIGRMFFPALKAVQVDSALKYLSESGFIAKDKSGKWIQCEAIVATPPRVRSTLLRSYHLKNLEINQQAYELFDIDERSLSSVTCSLSPESFEKVRHEIELFRERVLSIAREDSNPLLVCHLGIQWMPRAKYKRRKGK